jgi:hypothetical protein
MPAFFLAFSKQSVQRSMQRSVQRSVQRCRRAGLLFALLFALLCGFCAASALTVFAETARAHSAHSFPRPVSNIRSTDNTFPDTTNAEQRPTRRVDTNFTTATSTSVVMKKDPTLAAVLSIIPGAGQIYVEAPWWKAGLFLAGGGFCIGQTIFLAGQFNTYTRAYAALDSAERRTTAGTRTLTLREAYHDLRDTFAFITIGVMVFAAVDAYTGAHLYEFDVSDDLKASIYATPARIGFAVHGR